MKRLLFIALVLTLNIPTIAEERQQRSARSSSMYRLTFTLHVIEAGKDQPRHYTLVLEERSGGKIRALTKVPVKQGADITYIETGIKSDAEYTETEGRIRLQVELQYTGITASDPPSIHEWQTRVESTIAANEVSVLSTYDGGENGRRYQLDVKAEKLR